MKRTVFLLLVLSAVRGAYAQEHIDVRFYDPRTDHCYAHFRPGRVPLFLQNYAGAWHGIAYYDMEQQHKLFTGSYSGRKADVRNGQFVMYHLNGKKALAVQFRNNATDGPLYEFDDSGHVECIKTYSDGMLNGPARLYRADSSLLATQYWTYNRIDSATWYHPNAQPARQTVFRNSKPVRESCFDIMGTPRSCDAFKSRDALIPAVFRTTMTAAVRALARTEGLMDTTLYLTVSVEEDGQYKLTCLSRIRNPVHIGANNFFDFQKLVLRLMPVPDIAATPPLRERLQHQLDALPRAVPAYEQSVAVTSSHSLTVRLN